MGGDGRRRHRDSPQLTFRRVIRRATFSASPWEPVGYCGRKPMYPSTPSHRLHVSLRFLASRRLRLPGATRLRSARLRRLAFFARRRGVYRMAGIPFLPNASTAAPVRTARLSHIRFPALSATTSAAHTAASSRIAMFTSPKRITRSMATSPRRSAIVSRWCSPSARRRRFSSPWCRTVPALSPCGPMGGTYSRRIVYPALRAASERRPSSQRLADGTQGSGGITRVSFPRRRRPPPRHERRTGRPDVDLARHLRMVRAAFLSAPAVSQVRGGPAEGTTRPRRRRPLEARAPEPGTSAPSSPPGPPRADARA